MTATIIGFLATYTISSHWLFEKGLQYVSKLPAAGALLSDRLIYVMFFCFLMMLIFSVAVTGYISLYRNQDTRWLLTLPVSHRAVFLWKCFESAMFSSWGLVFILGPSPRRLRRNSGCIAVLFSQGDRRSVSVSPPRECTRIIDLNHSDSLFDPKAIRLGTHRCSSHPHRIGCSDSLAGSRNHRERGARRGL